MHILLSAYACEPGKGSEPGVGWNWALELARQGHTITVLTRANNQSTIEAELIKEPHNQLQFIYYDLPPWLRWWKKGGRGVHLYYQCWQFGAYRHIRRRILPEELDMVHHLTFGVFRQASFLGRLGLPFLVGPLGGGECAPRSLRQTFPLSGRLKDRLRDLSNMLARWDPMVRQMLRSADLIYCRTEQTREALPRLYRSKTRISLEVGVDPAWLAENVTVPNGPEFLSVARLIYWKGTHLVLSALATVLRTRSDARLTVFGIGPDEAWLKSHAKALAVDHAVDWKSWRPQSEVRTGYAQSLAMIFPTLHDSGGTAALESLSAGTPVICLDVGGPATSVPDHAGFKIAAEGKKVDEVIAGIAEAMLALANDRDLAVRMSKNALDYSRTRTWEAVVRGVYDSFAAVRSDQTSSRLRR